MEDLKKLGRLPFELAYLALLTRSKLKPLSRWEASLVPSEIETLEILGLDVAHLDRYTLLGRRLPRFAFSMSPDHTEAYRRRFSGKSLRRSKEAVRSEGWFLGYPSCCVNQFIERPYVPNGFSRGDQRILFHWACPGCRSTRSLLREYRLIYRECVGLFGGEVPEKVLSRRFLGAPERKRVGPLGKVLPWAASLAAFAFLPGLGGALDDDPHWLPAPDDVDLDHLSYAEEIMLGRSTTVTDSDSNGIPDGVDESLALSAVIAGLPRIPQVDSPYVIEFGVYGEEQCAVCGEWINMGFIRIVHPLRDLQVDVHFIALHYLEHGSLGYDGSIHDGRVDIDLLKRILFPCDPQHIILAAGNDGDGDQLGSEEEPLLLTDPEDPDTDDDSLQDGSQVAEELLTTLSALPREPMMNTPYLIEHNARGLETCAVCGEQMNMGYAEIVNPLENLTVEVPFVALHYLAHGSLGYSGDSHPSGRILPTVLNTVLSGDGGAHWMNVEEDGDHDGLKDLEEIDLGLDPGEPDYDGDGIPDGPDVAVFLHDFVDELPEGPLPDQKYVIHNMTFGVYQCLVCGEMINMGFMDVVDPVEAKSTTLNYYNHHFMEMGSFSTDRPGIYGRKDPRELVDVLGVNVAGAGEIPSAVLLGNTPNPFTKSTEISFNLPEKQKVTLTIFDAAGRRVCDLFSGEASKGRNTFTWDGMDKSGQPLTSGVYFCKLKAGSFVLSRKMLKLR